MKRVSSGYLPEAEPIKKLKNAREFEGDLPEEIIKQIISLGSLFLRNKEYLSSEYFETRSLVSKKWFVASNKAAAHFLNSNFDMKIPAKMIFTNEMRIKNFIKKFGAGLESFFFINYNLYKRDYTSEDIAFLPNLTTIYYDSLNQEELESIAEKCKKIKNVILHWSCVGVTISNSILSGFEKIESLDVNFSGFNYCNMKAMAEKFSNLKYLKVTWWYGYHKNELIKGKFPLLEELDLGASGTDDAGLAQIKDSFPLLKKLFLSRCGVTNLGVISQSFPLLEILNIDCCNVHLADIKDSYPLMKELHFHVPYDHENKELNNICNSFPLLTRLYLSSERVNFEVIFNFVKARPRNVNLTIHIQVPNLKDFDIQWKKASEDLFPHIKLVFISYGNVPYTRFLHKNHYELRS